MSNDRRPKAHIQYSGGIWQLSKPLDQTTTGVLADSLTAWLDDEALTDLVRTYYWWKNLGRGDARFTDNMILKRCQAYRFFRKGKRFPLEHQSRFGSRDVFTANPKSRFSKPHTQRTRDKAIHRAGSKTAKQQAENYLLMIEAGYCRVSNKSKRVSRIDTVDWRDRLALYHSPWDPDERSDVGFSRDAGDTYRRCLSKDAIIIQDEEIFKKFPASGDGPNVYLSHTTTLKDTK